MVKYMLANSKGNMKPLLYTNLFSGVFMTSLYMFVRVR